MVMHGGIGGGVGATDDKNYGVEERPTLPTGELTVTIQYIYHNSSLFYYTKSFLANVACPENSKVTYLGNNQDLTRLLLLCFKIK
jgi:hypothetical protein